MDLATVFLACGVGGLVALQAPLLGMVGLHAGGPLQAAVLAFLTGTSVIATLLVVRNANVPSLDALRHVPAWAWLGCLIGSGVLLASLQLVPRIGVARFAIASLTGQCLVSVTLDHVGAFGMRVRPVNWHSLLGILLAIAGAAVVGCSKR